MNNYSMTVWKEDTFDAAHHLPNYTGLCKNLHGHTYKVQIGLNGPVDHEIGMVLDMATLGGILASICRKLDHTLLNGIEGLENPTAENIAAWIYEKLPSYLDIKDAEVTIRVWETPTSWVELQG